MISHGGLNLTFLMKKDVEHYFMCLFATQWSSLVKCLFIYFEDLLLLVSLSFYYWFVFIIFFSYKGINPIHENMAV